jgi:serine/threonine protein kinase
VTTIGKYRVRRKLGEGGMGAVLLAEDPRGGAVVLKIPLRSTPEIVARMEDEATIGMQLRHAHIVKTLDFFMDEDRPVIVINHIEGTSLRELRDSVGALPAAMIARVGEQISDALSALHHLKDNTGRSLEILHRDVTPGNILVDRQGNACLIDLGIARSVLSTATKTSMGVLRGTFRYISPDLFRGGAYSWMTDLWALGVTLFEAAVGRKAAEGSQHQVFHAITEGHIATLRPGEQLHPALRYLFDGLLEVDADARRFRDPEDILHAFRVIRGRVGDGEHETIEVMKRVHIAMDEESIATGPLPVARAPVPAPAPVSPMLSAPATTKAKKTMSSTSLTTTPSGGSLLVDEGKDEFDDQTLVSTAADLDAADDPDAPETTNTIDTPIGPGESSRRVRRLPETVEEWGDHTLRTNKREDR